MFGPDLFLTTAKVKNMCVANRFIASVLFFALDFNCVYFTFFMLVEFIRVRRFFVTESFCVISLSSLNLK